MNVKAVVLLIIALFVSAGIGLTINIPDTPADAMGYTDAYGKGNTSFGWSSEGKLHSLTLDISEDDFRSSVNRNILRSATILVPSSYNLIEPDNLYVQQIAGYILASHPDCSDTVLATVCLDFVQETIAYAYDTDLYGRSEYWATPTETLYLRAGDCEDTSILLASILMAVGLDAVLLDYEGHMATGVRLTNGTGLSYAQKDGTYFFCETAADCHVPIGVAGDRYVVESPIVWYPSDSGTELVINSIIAGYRNLIQRIFSI